MWNVLSRARESYARNQSGNIGVIFAFAAVPMIGLMGGAVDMTRYTRHKAELLNAMDAGAIALVKRGAKDDADADTFVNDYIDTMLPTRDPMLHLNRFDAIKIAGGYRVVSNAAMDTAFMPVVGIRSMAYDLSTEVQLSGGNYEVALALDNTGSMAQHGRIEALRDAAGELVNDLYKQPGSDKRVKMALVPFVTAVNIKTPDVFSESWVQPTGDAATFGFNFNGSVNRRDLFNQMHVEWAGCVEARKAPYDEDDTEPTDAATRYVPYLWPDEPDGGSYGNSYLTDSGSGSALNKLRDTAKYRLPANVKAPNTSSRGPNAACPGPIVELTNDTARMHREIDKMEPHNRTGGNSSGTNVAQGLVWGWNVLSPDEPYDQGVAYSDTTTTKVLVLLSDGRNQLVPHGNAVRSDYTSYGYLAAGRLALTDYLAAERAVDDKVSRVCDNIKAKGIRVYTILFEVDFARTQDLFRECASRNAEGEPLFYYVPDPSKLQQAFADIGQDLTTLRVTR